MLPIIKNNFVVSVSSSIFHEAFKNELIIIDTKSGKYFQITGSGIITFKNILKGLSYVQLFDFFNFRSKYQIKNMHNFLNVLKTSKIIKLTKKIKLQTLISKKQKYLMTKIMIFNDMKDILINDPIHDIPKKSSWPKKK
jgi:hypothetical protein